MTMKGVASAGKIALHRERIDAYLRGEPIYPISLELDITSRCTRQCEDCPSSRSEYQHDLSMDFIRRLLGSFGGRVKGLLISGGESTMSPDFPRVLAQARREGFENVAVVTNGSLLHEDGVAEALLQYATTIRISLYDWDAKTCGGIQPVLRKIEGLRRRVDLRPSPLKIGVSALTTADRAPRLPELGEAVRSAGAHWIYYHPLCTGWNTGDLRQMDQEGVLETVNGYRERNRNGFGIFICPERYQGEPLTFNAYHAAHFLLVIGADGINYLGAEVKYQRRYALADVAGGWREDFLHQPERLHRIRSINSRTYTALRSRHRGVLYNDLIERLSRSGGFKKEESNFSFPFIL